MQSVPLKRSYARAATAIVLVGCSLLPGLVRADTLAEAFAAAYRNNPTIDARRARLRAVDEGVAIARSGYRPRLAATGIVGWERTIPNSPGTTVVGPTGRLTQGGQTSTAEYGLALSQPLFTGFQVTNRVRAAEALVRAGQQELRSAEHTLFLEVVDAYTDILTAQGYTLLFEAAVRDASRELRGARRRLELQETTKTDVAQAEALRAVALANLATAQGRVKTASAAYVEVVGQEPTRLVPPSFPRGRLPRSLQEAIAIGMKDHPLIISALYNEQAARNYVDEVRGRLLPQVDLNATYGQSNISDGSGADTTTVFANVRIPIYEGGANHAAVRQSKQIHLSNIQLIEVERSRVRRAITTAWTGLEVARKQLQFVRQQIDANKAAVIGIRREEAVGQRTLNDLYLAQRELLIAENAFLTAKRDELIASYRVLAEIGRLNPEAHLPSGSAVYDPAIHYEDVRRKWFGLSIVHADGRREYMKAKTP